MRRALLDRLMTILVVLGALFNIEVSGQNTCPRTYYVSESTSTSQGYTTSCGLWGWKRCTRYRYITTYRTAMRTVYDICCPGWSRDANNTCQIENPCEPPCTNGQLCVAMNVCQCPPGYKGNSCSEPICSPTCVNGGQCVSPNVCECPSGYSGKNCNKAIVSAVFEAGKQCLGGHVIKTVFVPSKMRCAATCLRHSQCKSVNYYSTKHLCELNDVTADEAGTSDWFSYTDCVHYQ